MEFKCPCCEHTQIECIQTDAIITSKIKVVDGCVEYGDNPEINDACIDRFQCSNCGWIIPGVMDDDELVEWMKAPSYEAVEDEDEDEE